MMEEKCLRLIVASLETYVFALSGPARSLPPESRAVGSAGLHPGTPEPADMSGPAEIDQTPTSQPAAEKGSPAGEPAATPDHTGPFEPADKPPPPPPEKAENVDFPPGEQTRTTRHDGHPGCDDTDSPAAAKTEASQAVAIDSAAVQGGDRVSLNRAPVQ